MSKWLKGKEKLFSKFKEEKKQEQESQNNAGPRRMDILWPTPEKGTVDKPKIYQLRLLPDTNDNFYKSFYYHMYKSATTGKWTFIFCPKSFNHENYCPFCSATMKLYQGSAEDKKIAYNYKRKRKHCVNAFIVKDPRDAEAESDDDKVSGKVLIYEYPDTVESKIRSEMNDEEYGNGINIFDPGEDGVDFLLKVGSTKPIVEDGPNKGKSFPDYSDSKFANKSIAIGSDSEIEKVMEQRHDLDAYLNGMVRKEEDLISLIKDEMLWDLIKSDFPNYIDNSSKSSDIPDNVEVPWKEESSEEKNTSSDDISDEDIMNELEALKNL